MAETPEQIAADAELAQAEQAEAKANADAAKPKGYNQQTGEFIR